MNNQLQNQTRAEEVQATLKDVYGATCSIQELGFGIMKVSVSEKTSPTAYITYIVIIGENDDIELQIEQARNSELESESTWGE